MTILYSQYRRGVHNWELTTDDGNNVVAVNRQSGEAFSGTRAAFYALVALPDGDTGNVSSGGTGIITTSGRVADCNRHMLFATHVSATISTVDVCVDWKNDTWMNGVFFQPLGTATPQTWVDTLAAGKHGLLYGVYERVRINCVAASSGRIFSYRE